MSSGIRREPTSRQPGSSPLAERVARSTLAGCERSAALAYLGQPSDMTQSRLAQARCEDPTYMQMRLARLSLLKAPPGAPVSDMGDLLRRAARAADSSRIEIDVATFRKSSISLQRMIRSMFMRVNSKCAHQTAEFERSQVDGRKPTH
jgi:hypothetical protein